MAAEPPRETALASQYGFAGRLLRVRVDTVRLPNGGEGVREVVEHPGAVAVVALTADDRLLLVQQYRHAAGRMLLELPAGTLEPDEPPVETARRELIEETGHAAARLTEVVTFFPSPGYSAERIVLFRADGCVPVRHERAAEEPTRVVPVAMTDVPRLLTPGPDQVTDGKTLVGLLWLLHEASRH